MDSSWVDFCLRDRLREVWGKTLWAFTRTGACLTKSLSTNRSTNSTKNAASSLAHVILRPPISLISAYTHCNIAAGSAGIASSDGRHLHFQGAWATWLTCSRSKSWAAFARRHCHRAHAPLDCRRHRPVERPAFRNACNKDSYPRRTTVLSRTPPNCAAIWSATGPSFRRPAIPRSSCIWSPARASAHSRAPYAKRCYNWKALLLVFLRARPHHHRSRPARLSPARLRPDGALRRACGLCVRFGNVRLRFDRRGLPG